MLTLRCVPHVAKMEPEFENCYEKRLVNFNKKKLWEGNGWAPQGLNDALVTAEAEEEYRQRRAWMIVRGKQLEN
jgi:hypothetical protein